MNGPEAVGPHDRYLDGSPRHTMVGPRLVHKRQAPADLLIRRLCYAHPLPAHSAADLLKRYSLVRSRRQR